MHTAYTGTSSTSSIQRIVIWLCIVVGTQSKGFTSWPSLQRASPDNDVTLTWRVDYALGSADNGVITRPDKGEVVVVQYTFSGLSVVYGPGYDSSKVSLIIQTGSDGIIMTLMNINTADAGPYKCSHTPSGKPQISNDNATIYVYDTPSKPTVPSPGDISLGTSVILSCSGSTSTSQPEAYRQPLVYIWRLNGTSQTVSPQARHTVYGDKLTISGVVKEDRYQLYTCVTTENGGLQSEESDVLTLLVLFAPHSIRLDGSDRPTAVAGVDRVTRTCSAICNPGCAYQWKDKDGRNVGRGDRLDLNPAEKNHHGTYTCWATNVHNTAGITKDFILTVNYFPEVVAPFSSSITDPVETDSLTLSCKISSRPDSTIQIQNTDTGTTLTEASGQEVYYTYSSVQCLDSANYQCTADNDVGNILRQILFMNVKCPFTPAKSIQRHAAAVGDYATFNVLTTANPYPDITKADWTFSPLNETSGSRTVPDNCYVSVRNSSHMVQRYVTMVVVNVTLTNYGNYTLTAQNHIGLAAQVVFELLMEETDLGPTTSLAPIIGGAVGGLLVAGLAIGLIVLWRRGIIPIKTKDNVSDRRNADPQIDHHTTTHVEASESTKDHLYQMTERSTKQMSDKPAIYQSLAKPSLSEIPQSNIVLESILRKGDSYTLWTGKLQAKKDNTPLHVIIKKINKSSDVLVRYLEGQGIMMTKLSNCDWTIGCLGTTTEHDLLILDNAPLGNLGEYLQATSGAAYCNVGSDQSNITEMNFIHQINNAVVAIQELQPPALFYCLSASHVLVTSHTQCKVTGFALADVVTAREQWEETHKVCSPVIIVYVCISKDQETLISTRTETTNANGCCAHHYSFIQIHKSTNTTINQFSQSPKPHVSRYCLNKF